MHARLHTAHMYFLKTKLPTTRSERVLLGDKSTPPPALPRPPPCTKIKTHREVGGGVYTPLVHRSQQGLLIVTCARSAPSQSPVSQMHAGRSGPPPLDSSRAAERL